MVPGQALPVLCGVLVLRHHLWHVNGRARHGEGRLLLLSRLLQGVRARGSAVSSGGHGRGRRGQRRPGLRGGHRRGGRR